MQEPEREIKDKKTIEEILVQNRELSLAMIDGDRPYVLPLNYGYADGCLYIHCARQGKKLDCLRSNPKVCFDISQMLKRIGGDAPCMWSTKFRSVVGHGTAVITDDREEKIAGYDILMRHFGGPVGNYEEKDLNDSLIIKITIESMTGKQN